MRVRRLSWFLTQKATVRVFQAFWKVSLVFLGVFRDVLVIRVPQFLEVPHALSYKIMQTIMLLDNVYEE